MNLKPGCAVRQRVRVIEGVVAQNGIRWNPGYERFEVLVQHTGQNGVPQERWFLEDEVELVQEGTPAPPLASGEGA